MPCLSAIRRAFCKVWRSSVCIRHARKSVLLCIVKPRMRPKCAGPDDLGTLDAGALWAGALARAGRWREALPLLENALPAWRKAHPAGSPNLFTELSYLGLAYLEAGRYKEAERIGAELLASSAKLQGAVPSNDRRFGLTHWLMGWALAGQNRYREALPQLEEADRILSSHSATPLERKDAARVQALLNEVRSHLRAQ